MKRNFLFAALALLPASVLTTAAFAPQSAKAPVVSYKKQIQPILTKNCVSCHSGAKPADGLDFSNGKFAEKKKLWGNGDPTKSKFVREITPKADGKAAMPPGQKALSAAQIKLISQWIKEGSKTTG